MDIAILVVITLLAAALSVRRIPRQCLAVRTRLGVRQLHALAGGYVWIIPFIDKLEFLSAEPFSVSLPPQSSITRDEIPIQLQASLDARVLDVNALIVDPRDWRLRIVAILQQLMKDGVEELDFDRVDELFPAWVQSVRRRLNESARAFGVEVTNLQISNLSPRSRPVAD